MLQISNQKVKLPQLAYSPAPFINVVSQGLQSVPRHSGSLVINPDCQAVNQAIPVYQPVFKWGMRLLLVATHLIAEQIAGNSLRSLPHR